MINFLEAGMTSIFNDPTSIFIHGTARQILFEGIEVDCDRKPFSAKTICSFLKKDARIKDVDHNLKYKFAILNGVRINNYQSSEHECC